MLVTNPYVENICFHGNWIHNLYDIDYGILGNWIHMGWHFCVIRYYIGWFEQAKVQFFFKKNLLTSHTKTKWRENQLFSSLFWKCDVNRVIHVAIYLTKRCGYTFRRRFYKRAMWKDHFSRHFFNKKTTTKVDFSHRFFTEREKWTFQVAGIDVA